MESIEFKDFMKRDISPLIQMHDKFVDIKGIRELAYTYKLDYTRHTNIKVPDKVDDQIAILDDIRAAVAEKRHDGYTRCHASNQSIEEEDKINQLK